MTLANLRPEILSAENQVQIATALVNDTLGRPIEASIDVVAELEIPDPIPVVLHPEALRELAGQQRPELLRYKKDRDVLDARIGVVRSDLKPRITASGSFGVNTFAPQDVSSLALHTWAVGVNFNWTIFDGKKTASQVAALRSQVTQKGYDESTFRSRLAIQLEEATGTWRRALEALEVTTLTVEQAREAERVAEESLKWGAATSLDVLQASAALRESELNQTQAAHDALVALAEMKFLVGFRADAPDSVIAHERTVASTGTDEGVDK